MIVIIIQIVPILLVQMTQHVRVVAAVPIIRTTNPVMQIRIVSGVEKIKFVKMQEEGQNPHQIAVTMMAPTRQLVKPTAAGGTRKS